MDKRCILAMKKLDWAVLMVLIASVIFGVIAQSTQSLTHTPTGTVRHIPAVILLIALPSAVLACVVLLLWLVKGDGARSNLWNWLPPFVCFRHLGCMGRSVIIIVIVLGTLGGIVAFLFGV